MGIIILSFNFIQKAIKKYIFPQTKHTDFSKISCHFSKWKSAKNRGMGVISYNIHIYNIILLYIHPTLKNVQDLQDLQDYVRNSLHIIKNFRNFY